MTENEKIGFCLRNLRKRASLNQTQASERLGHNKQWLCEIEKGRSRPFFEDVKLLVRLYDSSLSELVRMIDEL